MAGQGGIVTRAELLLAGWSADELRIAHGMGIGPTRLRRGWYGAHDIDPVVRQAWEHGGALACWSALEWHAARGAGAARAALHALNALNALNALGQAPVAHHSDEPSRTLHICLPPHAHVRRIEAEHPLPLMRHWHPTATRRASRRSVPVEVAIEQARWCRR